MGTATAADQTTALLEQLKKLDRDAQSEAVDAAELARSGSRKTLDRHRLARQLADRQLAEQSERTARLVNMVIPVGWLPLGVMAAAQGNPVPAILGLLGMTLIGSASLWRAYRTTVGLYQGQFTKQNGRPMPAVAKPATRGHRGTLLLEAHLPGLSEPVSAIALGGFRSLVRSPEAKMMLLTPADHDPDLRVNALERAPGHSGVDPAARRHCGNDPRALRRPSADG